VLAFGGDDGFGATVGAGLLAWLAEWAITGIVPH